MFVYQRVNHLFLNMRPLGRQKVTQKIQPYISSSLAFHLSWFSHVLSLCFLVFNVSVLLLAIIIPNAHGLVLLGGFNPSEKYESQMGKIKKTHVPNHQPALVSPNSLPVLFSDAGFWMTNVFCKTPRSGSCEKMLGHVTVCDLETKTTIITLWETNSLLLKMAIYSGFSH